MAVKRSSTSGHAPGFRDSAGGGPARVLRETGTAVLSISDDKVSQPIAGSIEDFLAFVDEFASWTGYTATGEGR